MLRFFLLLTTLVFNTVYASQTLKVGLINSDRPPYFWQPDNGSPPYGLYIDILEAIEARTDLKFEYHFLPQSRIRQNMTNGVLDLEPGIDISWRQEPGEYEASVYSRVFLESDEVLVFSDIAFTARTESKKLNHLQNCSVIGFNTDKGLDDLSVFNKRELTYEHQILNLLHLGRCSFSLMPIDVLEYHLKNKEYSVSYSEPFKRYRLRLRLNRQHQSQLSLINQALEEIINNGQLKTIFSKYLIRYQQ